MKCLDCLSSGPLTLGTTCAESSILLWDLLGLHHCNIIAAMVASIAVCVMACVMLWSDAIFSYFFFSLQGFV